MDNAEQEQKLMLQAALTVVKQQGFGMSRAIDADSVNYSVELSTK